MTDHAAAPIRRIVVAAAVLLAITARPVAAQDLRDVVAYFALTATPSGALPPSSFGADVPVAPASIDLLYGRKESDGAAVNNFGVAFGSSRGRSRLGVTAGAITCEGCNGVVMLRLDSEVLLSTDSAGGGALAIGVQPAFGIAKAVGADAGEGFALSATVGLPVSFTTGGPWRATIFVTPGIGVGMLTALSADGIGYRPMLGAGMRARGPSGMGVVLGVQKVFIEGGDTLVGLGLTIPAGRPTQ